MPKPKTALERFRSFAVKLQEAEFRLGNCRFDGVCRLVYGAGRRISESPLVEHADFSAASRRVADGSQATRQRTGRAVSRV